MSNGNDIRISDALTLHRQGKVTEAKAVYESVLRDDESNADAMGLLGMVAIQDGQRSKAEALWRRSLAFASKPLVRIRNLNNLVVTLVEEGRETEAVALMEHADVPDWSGQLPDERELKTIMSLALFLQRANATKKLRALLEPVAALLPGDKDARRFLAAARFQDGDHASALEILATFDESDDLWIMTTRLTCAQELGRRDEAEAERKRIIQSAPVYISERFRRDLKTVLVINSSERIRSTDSVFELHFNANFPTQLTESLAEEFNFVSVFTDGDYRRLGDLKPDLILNNMVNAEMLSRDDKQKIELSSLAESYGVPVINHPMRAALTTRQRAAFWLKDLENVRTPATLRFEALDTDADNQIRGVETKIGYPLVIRPTFTHFGVGMIRIENADELRREIRSRTGQQVYVHEFIENRTPDRLFRKIRVAIVDNEIMPILVDFDEDWNVHGRTTPERKLFYRQRPHLLDLERYVFQQPNQILSAKVLQTLQEIRKKIPLDIFGIDFDVMPDGTVLFFEANASMVFYAPYGPGNADVERPEEAFTRPTEAIKRYFRQKVASG